jgi:hypothetical protein
VGVYSLCLSLWYSCSASIQLSLIDGAQEMALFETIKKIGSFEKEFLLGNHSAAPMQQL